MKKYIPILTGVLLVQIGLFAYVQTRQEATATFQANEKLLSFSFDQVDRLEITDAAGTKLELKKQDGVWQLPSYFTFPANSKKIEELSQALNSFKKSWPVAKTAVAAKQLKVASDKFERQVDFYAGDKKLQSLYFGSSPSFRKVHARVDDVMVTYTVDYNTYDLPANSKDWIDHKFLSFDKTKVKELAVSGVTLKQENGEFTLAGIAADQQTATEKTSAYIGKLLNANFDEVIDFKDKVTLGEKVNSLTLTTTDDQKVELVVYRNPAAAGDTKKDAKASKDSKDKAAAAAQPKPEEDFIVVVSDRPHAFKVRANKVNELFKIDSNELIKKNDLTSSTEPVALPEIK